MWYIDSHEWKPAGYHQALDDMLSAYSGDDGTTVDADGGGLISDLSIIEARSHGNPYFDTASIMYNADTESKRAEVPFYEQEFAHDEPTQAKRFLKLVPGASEHVQGGFYIIDVDDPELVNGGELHLHRQLTDHYAELTKGPIESWPAWLRDNVFPYVAEIFFTDIVNGHVPAGIVVEPVRQHLGLPYAWHGARVDDDADDQITSPGAQCVRA